MAKAGKAGKTEKSKEDDIFCKIAIKEVNADIIYESENFITIPDIHPRTPGHSIILTKKHYTNLMDMPASLGSEMLDVIKKVFEIRAKEGYEGFNIVANNFPAAGQAVMHAHIHLLPRKASDGKDLGL